MLIPRNEQQIKAFDAINARAATDADYRTRLLETPHAALAELGYNVPETYRIKFVEKSADADAVVVLPDLVSQAGELSAEQLEAVAGGGWWSDFLEAIGFKVETEVKVEATACVSVSAGT